MSILNVEHLSHGFGDRTIFTDVSFRLLKGEHIGLIGANGEGKSTFMNIITGKLMPDEGKIEWAKRVRVGYLDQHTVLKPGMTIRDVLASAFDFLFEIFFPFFSSFSIFWCFKVNMIMYVIKSTIRKNSTTSFF